MPYPSGRGRRQLGPPRISRLLMTSRERAASVPTSPLSSAPPALHDGDAGADLGSDADSNPQQGDSVAGDGVDPPAPVVWPETIEGAIVRRCDGHSVRGEAGLRVISNRHVGCSKYRSIQLETAEHGARAAELSLGPGMRMPDHKGTRPTVAQVREYRDSVP